MRETSVNPAGLGACCVIAIGRALHGPVAARPVTDGTVRGCIWCGRSVRLAGLEWIRDMEERHAA